MNYRNALGVTLIELLIFIVVIGIIAGGVYRALSISLIKSPGIDHTLTATTLAEERMELILGVKHRLGFDDFTQTTFDPCTAGAQDPVCTQIPSGYTVTSQLQDILLNGEVGYKEIQVSVTGKGNATMTSYVAQYLED